MVQLFWEKKLIPYNLVEELLEYRSGEILRWMHGHYVQRSVSPVAKGKPVVGIFPNQKTVRHFFHREVQIIHDLSALLTPEFHHGDTVDFHAAPFLDDAATNALSVCVSQATADDLTTYFSTELAGKVVVCQLGADSTEFELARAKMKVAPPGPFVMVLGTLEPRKNIEFLLKEFARSPSILEKYTFMFMGRVGWGTRFSDQLEKYGLAKYLENGRIITPGFVDQATKCLLMATADCVIYPSLFEGFGLPNIEARAARTPVITTASSSLPEAGGEDAFYIPIGGEGADIEQALSTILAKPRPAFPVQGVRSWTDFTDEVFDAIDKLDFES